MSHNCRVRDIKLSYSGPHFFPRCEIATTGNLRMTRFLQFLRDFAAALDAVNAGRILALQSFMSGTEHAAVVSSHKSIVRGD